MRRAMEKADFKSVRGDFKFGKNHVPGADRSICRVPRSSSDGYAMKTGEQIVAADVDKYVDKCDMPK